MGTLRFKKLKIMSDLHKTAREFEFADRYNLILAEGKNSVGKSSVVKSIFWCLGCDPFLDAKWNSLEAKVYVEFEIDERKYWVARQGSRLILSENGSRPKVFDGVTGEYAAEFQRIVGFNALLPKRNENEVVVPPAAFYFLPFYIDQKLSWSNAWAGFDGLGQFSAWQREIVSYHVGMINKSYFMLTDEVYQVKRKKSEIKAEIEKIDGAISVVSSFMPSVSSATMDLGELEGIQQELKEDIFVLHGEQERLFERIATLRSEKSHLHNQLVIAKDAVGELDRDYEFASEMEEEEILCPTCGTVHDNSLINRFSLLEDRNQAEQIVSRIQRELEVIDSELVERDAELSGVRKSINALNDKYYKETDDRVVTLQSVLDEVAAHSLMYKAGVHKKDKGGELFLVENEEASLLDERKESFKNQKKIVTKKFVELYPAFVSMLKAFAVDVDVIKSPLDYKKVVNNGGAAECSRAMLAYYVAIYNLIYLFGEEVLGPLVIDTPNQQEQAANHYESIVKLISEQTPSHSQIFLCGMNSPKLAPLFENAKVYSLDREHALLVGDQYSAVNESIGWIFDSIN